MVQLAQLQNDRAQTQKALLHFLDEIYEKEKVKALARATEAQNGEKRAHSRNFKNTQYIS